MPEKCLIPGCTRTLEKAANARGMCGVCYQAARRAIKVKETTWLELEILGLTRAPTRKNVPRPPTAFELALKKARRHAATQSVLNMLSSQHAVPPGGDHAGDE